MCVPFGGFDLFPDDRFSPYMSGCFLAMTRDILPIIVKQCEKIGPIIYFDDVFLGQIVKISNISLVSFPYYKVQYYPKAYSGNEYSKIWAIHRYTPADNLALWQMANLWTCLLRNRKFSLHFLFVL